MYRLVAIAAAAALLGAPAADAAQSASLTISPRVVTLGKVAVGSTVESAATLTNTGSEPITLFQFEAFGYNGNFQVMPGSCALGTTLASGDSCSFSVTTTPSLVGAIRGEFCFTGSGASDPYARECSRIVGGAS